MKAEIIVTLYIKNVTGALYMVNYNENTLSVSVSVNAAWNSVILTARRNDCSEVAALTDDIISPTAILSFPGTVDCVE